MNTKRVIYIILFQRKSVLQLKRIQLKRHDWNYDAHLIILFLRRNENQRRVFEETYAKNVGGTSERDVCKFCEHETGGKDDYWRHTSLINWFSIC